VSAPASEPVWFSLGLTTPYDPLAPVDDMGLTAAERAEIVARYAETHRPKPEDARRLREWLDRKRAEKPSGDVLPGSPS